MLTEQVLADMERHPELVSASGVRDLVAEVRRLRAPGGAFAIPVWVVPPFEPASAVHDADGFVGPPAHTLAECDSGDCDEPHRVRGG